MYTRFARFFFGLVCMAIGGFILLACNVLIYPPSGLQFSNFAADMLKRATLAVLFIGVFNMAGWVLMIWGIISRDVRPIRPRPVQLDFSRANLKPWTKPAQAEPDAVTRPDSSDIQ